MNYCIQAKFHYDPTPNLPSKKKTKATEKIVWLTYNPQQCEQEVGRKLTFSMQMLDVKISKN